MWDPDSNAGVDQDNSAGVDPEATEEPYDSPEAINLIEPTNEPTDPSPYNIPLANIADNEHTTDKQYEDLREAVNTDDCNDAPHTDPPQDEATDLGTPIQSQAKEEQPHQLNLVPFDFIPEQGRYNLHRRGTTGIVGASTRLTATRLGTLMP